MNYLVRLTSDAIKYKPLEASEIVDALINIHRRIYSADRQITEMRTEDTPVGFGDLPDDYQDFPSGQAVYWPESDN